MSMNTIKSKCHRCKAPLEFPATDIGMKSTCPACGATIGLVEPIKWYEYPFIGIGVIWTAGMIIATLLFIGYVLYRILDPGHWEPPPE